MSSIGEILHGTRSLAYCRWLGYPDCSFLEEQNLIHEHDKESKVRHQTQEWVEFQSLKQAAELLC